MDIEGFWRRSGCGEMMKPDGDEEPADPAVFRGTGPGHGARETLSEMRTCGGT